MNSEEPTSLPAVTSSFTQQGTIDWVSLEQQTLSFSFGIIARLSADNVDALTVSVGQVIFHRFCLGPAGRNNVREALQSLRSYSSFGNFIWFGFGIRSLLRSLGDTDQGTTLLALCAAIGDCFHPDLGAEVLHEMTLSYKAPGHLIPSVLQWSALIKACSGLFTATSFPLLAEKFMSFAPSATRFTTYVGDVAGHMTGRGFPYPSDLAAALNGLCKVSCNEMESMSIRGGPACGWLAAVAVWLLNLPVTVSRDGQILYSNTTESLPARVQVIFDSQSCPDSREMELMTATYHLRNSAEFLHLVDEGLRTTTMSGRLRWDTCLSAAFGNEFKELLKTPRIVGIALGCAARIFKAIVRSESGFDRDIERHWRSYMDTAHGLGFVENTVTWFPELRPIKDHMEVGAKMNLHDAKAQYEHYLRMIETRCSCVECHRSDFVEREFFCLATLFETITTLSHTLAGFVVSESIYPSRAGFELCYIKQRRMRMNDEVSRKVDFIGPIIRVLETTPRLSDNESEDLADGLREGLRLFVGQDTFDLTLPVNVSAISAGGLCLYLDILCDLSVDQDVIGRVHVVRGRIERHGKPFDFVLDREDTSWFHTAPKDKVPDFTDISMIAEEKVRALKVNYSLKDKTGITVQVPPAKLAYEVCLARGLVNCRTYQCKNVISIKTNADKLELYALGGKQIVLAKGDQWFRCVLLFLESIPSSSPRAHCILRTNECIQCCFRAAMEIDDDQSVLIIS